MKLILTHKGWIGLCPVYMTDPETDMLPHVGSRYSWLNWWLVANDWVLKTFFGPGVPILVTGQLDEPKTFNVTIES